FSVLLAYLMTLSSDIRPAKARTITIPDGYLTIQEAINHATDGDIVFASARSVVYLIAIKNCGLPVFSDQAYSLPDNDNLMINSCLDEDCVPL
ncbi:MAG: hypothetical protein NWE78_08315, partial [Candidatus Bathyarchaeota archaeon]|nr:hypothetical protein [Candidatus Bathyarchaeota archaeon]